MADLQRRYEPNGDFVYRRIDNETILVPIADNVAEMDSIYALNDVGALIWELLDGRNTLEDIKDSIAAEFTVSKQEASVDLCEYIDHLAALGAVVESG